MRKARCKVRLINSSPVSIDWRTNFNPGARKWVRSTLLSWTRFGIRLRKRPTLKFLNWTLGVERWAFASTSVSEIFRAPMNLLINLLSVFFVLVALLMVLVILMQRPKSEGLGAAFGGGVTENIFGAQTTNVLVKF